MLLLITADMVTPTVFYDTIHLDSVLMREYYIQQNTEEYYLKSINLNDVETFDMPYFGIDIDTRNNIKKYKCSDMIWNEDKTTISFWNRRFTFVGFENYLDINNKIRLGSGPDKNYRVTMIQHLCKKLMWIVEGDKNIITKYLYNIQYLGKKSSQGKGKIKGWSIKEIHDTDISYCLYHNNLIATIPYDFDINLDCNKKMSFYKPPYFLSINDRRQDYRLCYDIDKNIITKIYNELI